MTNSMNYSSERFDGKEEGRKKGVAEEGGEERGFHAKAGTRELAAWEAYAQSRGETLDYSRKWGGAHVPSQWPPTE